MNRVLKRLNIFLIAIFIVMPMIVGCSNEDSSGKLQGSKYDSNITRVQNGYPNLIPNITYNDAYSHFFGNPQWRGFEADDGSEVVEFSGECTYDGEYATVYIQFVIDSEDSFSMYYAAVDVGDEKIVADQNMFVDLVYTPFATYSEEVLGEELPQNVLDSFYEYY